VKIYEFIRQFLKNSISVLILFLLLLFATKGFQGEVGRQSLPDPRIQQMQRVNGEQLQNFNRWLSILAKKEEQAKKRERQAERRLRALHQSLVTTQTQIKEELEEKFYAIDSHMSMTEDRIKRNIESQLQKISIKDEQVRLETEKTLKSQQLQELHKKLVDAEDRMQKKLAGLVDRSLAKSQAREQVQEEKYKKELEDLTVNFVSVIDQRLSANNSNAQQKIDNAQQEADNRMKELVEKLKSVNATSNTQLLALQEKLARLQKEKMEVALATPENDGGPIPQSEVDALVKHEVKKQLSSLKYRRDPRLARLRKVVALEKMRRLVKGLAHGEDYDDEIDF